MLVSNIAVVPVRQKLIGSPLQISNSLKERSLEIISNTSSPNGLMKESVINGSVKPQSLSNIFPVQFVYLKKLISTKVIKVDHGYDNPFYKIALTTLLHGSASLCWLQFQPPGWVTLLGPELNKKLKWAMTSAIERYELLVDNRSTEPWKII